MIRLRVGDVTPEAAAPLLTERERAALAAFPVEKRRTEWLAGTLAAKAAVRELRGPIPWRDIEALNGPDKDRLVTLPEGVAPLGVTISHAAGVAIALAFDPERERVGIDVDAIEPRSPFWLMEAFTAAERERLGVDERAATLAWCAKEAVLKALGTGLSVDLHSLEVDLPDGITVALRGAAQERLALIGGRDVQVRAWTEDGRAYAVARITRG